jgi:bifunctional DNA-binding transcriptional regulator/antitoxin component of YhaV-PrlF toxin-antitoxin module
MKEISIIRDRGQLTIPDSIRKTVSWVNPMSAISITVVKPDEIIIKPHQVQVDWDKIWLGIKKARSIKGKNGKGNLSEFIAEDRYNH